jgi:hypothetical protein
VEALKHIDFFDIFDQSEATPVLLLDGHGSIFDIDFLDYVTKKETERCALIGVPYGTQCGK